MGHSREVGYAVINLVKPQLVLMINDAPLYAAKQQQRRVSSPYQNTTILLFRQSLSGLDNVVLQGAEGLKKTGLAF